MTYDDTFDLSKQESQVLRVLFTTAAELLPLYYCRFTTAALLLPLLMPEQARLTGAARATVLLLPLYYCPFPPAALLLSLLMPEQARSAALVHVYMCCDEDVC